MLTTPFDPTDQARQAALKNSLGGKPPLPAAPGGAQDDVTRLPQPTPDRPSLGGPTAPAPAPAPPVAPGGPPPGPPGGSQAPGGDPFAAMGGGIQMGDSWVPRDHPASFGRAGSTAAPAPQTIQGSFATALERLLSGPSPQEAGQDVMSSPAVTGYQLARQKQEERDRAFLAERSAAGGQSASGGFEAGLMGLRQEAGSDLARYAGDQAQQSEQGRRQELLTALAMAQQMGDSASARAIQMQLAQMQQGQFSDRLGFDIADREAYWNNLALQNLFGGA